MFTHAPPYTPNASLVRIHAPHSRAPARMQVRIKHGGSMRYLGVYADDREAAEQWDLAALRLRGPVSV